MNTDTIINCSKKSRLAKGEPYSDAGKEVDHQKPAVKVEVAKMAEIEDSQFVTEEPHVIWMP